MNCGNKLEARPVAPALLAAFLLAGCAAPRTADVPADHPHQRAQIERRLQEVLVAAETKDFHRLDSYHLYGPRFTKFTGSSPDRLDAAAGQKGEHEGLGSTQGLKMRADGLKIDVFGDVGIATFILDYSFQAGGESVRRRDRSTLVFVRERGEWKIAHEHLSPIQR